MVILKFLPHIIIFSHTITQESLVWVKITKRHLPSHVNAYVEQEAHHYHHWREQGLALALRAEIGQGGDDANHVVPAQASAIGGADEEKEHAAEYQRHVEHEHVGAAVGYEAVVFYDDVEEEYCLKEVFHAEAGGCVVLCVFRYHAIGVAVGGEQGIGQRRNAKEEEAEHDTEDCLGGVFPYGYEIQREEQQCRLVDLVGYEPHYEKLPQLPLEDIANAQPHDRGSQHLAQVSEREVEPKAKENHHGVGIVGTVAPQRLVEEGVDDKGNHEDKDIAVGGEPRHHYVQEDVTLLAREEQAKGTTVVAAHGCGVGDGVEHLAVDVAVVAAKHVAHAHEDGEQRHVGHQEHLVLAVLEQLIGQGWYQEQQKIKPHKDVLYIL